MLRPHILSKPVRMADKLIDTQEELAPASSREFALYGETTGETDEFGLPVRHNWAAEYRGNADPDLGAAE